MQLKDIQLIRYVATRIAQAYPGKSGSIEETNQYIHQALASIAPFRPNQNDMMRLNMYLRNRHASEVACMAAWALYKDYISLPDKPRIVNG